MCDASTPCFLPPHLEFLSQMPSQQRQPALDISKLPFGGSADIAAAQILGRVPESPRDSFPCRTGNAAADALFNSRCKKVFATLFEDVYHDAVRETISVGDDETVFEDVTKASLMLIDYARACQACVVVNKAVVHALNKAATEAAIEATIEKRHPNTVKETISDAVANAKMVQAAARQKRTDARAKFQAALGSVAFDIRSKASNVASEDESLDELDSSNESDADQPTIVSVVLASASETAQEDSAACPAVGDDRPPALSAILNQRSAGPLAIRRDAPSPAGSPGARKKAPSNKQPERSPAIQTDASSIASSERSAAPSVLADERPTAPSVISHQHSAGLPAIQSAVSSILSSKRPANPGSIQRIAPATTSNDHPPAAPAIVAAPALSSRIASLFDNHHIRLVDHPRILVCTDENCSHGLAIRPTIEGIAAHFDLFHERLDFSSIRELQEALEELALLPLDKVHIDTAKLPMRPIKELQAPRRGGYRCTRCSYTVMSRSAINAHLHEVHRLAGSIHYVHARMIQMFHKRGSYKRYIHARDS